jgi:hypothetical protein
VILTGLACTFCIRGAFGSFGLWKGRVVLEFLCTHFLAFASQKIGWRVGVKKCLLQLKKLGKKVVRGRVFGFLERF